MVLINATDSWRIPQCASIESKGGIVYKFVDGNTSFPMIMQNLSDPMPKVMANRNIWQKCLSPE